MNPELYKLYEDNKTSLSNFVFNILKDHHHTQDVMQELWIRLNKQNYDNLKGHERQWMFTVSRNLSIKIFHKRNRFVELDEEWDSRHSEDFSPDELMEHNEFKKKIKSLLNKLKDTHKKVIVCRYYHDMSYEQIGKKLKISTGNVGFILHTAIKKLKEEFDKVNKNGNYAR